jgi:hypothetical protein
MPSRSHFRRTVSVDGCRVCMIRKMLIYIIGCRPTYITSPILAELPCVFDQLCKSLAVQNYQHNSNLFVFTAVDYLIRLWGHACTCVCDVTQNCGATCWHIVEHKTPVIHSPSAHGDTSPHDVCSMCARRCTDLGLRITNAISSFILSWFIVCRVRPFGRWKYKPLTQLTKLQTKFNCKHRYLYVIITSPERASELGLIAASSQRVYRNGYR